MYKSGGCIIKKLFIMDNKNTLNGQLSQKIREKYLSFLDQLKVLEQEQNDILAEYRRRLEKAKIEEIKKELL